VALLRDPVGLCGVMGYVLVTVCRKLWEKGWEVVCDPGRVYLLSFAAYDAHQVTWCRIQKLCTNNGERRYAGEAFADGAGDAAAPTARALPPRPADQPMQGYTTLRPTRHRQDHAGKDWRRMYTK
jgi:hypothetical protein